MTQHGGVAGEQLRQFIAKIERLEAEKSGLTSDIREVYTLAKSSGFDPKIMRQIVRLRKLDPKDRMEQEAVLDVYKHALGMALELQEEAA